MQIHLRNIKINTAFSDETTCFTASVYLDGNKAGEVCNDGRGGANFFTPYTVERELNTYGATLPERSLDVGAGILHNVKQDSETLISALLTRHLIEKDLKKALKKSICYTKLGQTGLFQTKTLTAEQIDSFLLRTDLHVKWQIDRILNTLSFADAVTAWLDADADTDE